MKITIIFGDNVKCQYNGILNDSDNVDIYKYFYNLIHLNFEKILRNNDFLLRSYCDPRYFYTDIFVDCILNFETWLINEKFHLSVNPNNTIMSLYDFNFQKTY